MQPNSYSWAKEIRFCKFLDNSYNHVFSTYSKAASCFGSLRKKQHICASFTSSLIVCHHCAFVRSVGSAPVASHIPFAFTATVHEARFIGAVRDRQVLQRQRTPQLFEVHVADVSESAVPYMDNLHIQQHLAFMMHHINPIIALWRKYILCKWYSHVSHWMSCKAVIEKWEMFCQTVSAAGCGLKTSCLWEKVQIHSGPITVLNLWESQAPGCLRSQCHGKS